MGGGAYEKGRLARCRQPQLMLSFSIEFIPICGRNSRSSTWRTRRATSGGCGATLSLLQGQALPHCERPHPLVEGGRPRSGDGTLLCPAQLPGALESMAANGLIGINSNVFA